MSFHLPKAALEQHIAVLGKTRSGKSSVMRGLVEGLLERKLPVCIVDPKGDWWGIKLAADGKRPGYPVVIFGGEHADVPINAHAGSHVAELFATGNRPCLIDLGGWMVGERTRFWIDFASTVFKHTKGNRWLVVDEVHNFCPKGKIMDPDSGKALHWTNRLASEGLGKGLAMIFASQRPQKVHNDTLTSAETLIAMRVLHPSDREAIADWIKGCGDAVLGKKVLDSLSQMERGEGWAWSPEVGFGPERVKFPMFKTYDSYRAQTIQDAKGLKGWAEVDLDDVKAKLASVVEEATANDPKALKAEIAKLKKELATKPNFVAPSGPAKSKPQDARTIQNLRRGIEDAMKIVAKINATGFEATSIDPEQIRKAVQAAADQIVKQAEQTMARRQSEFERLKKEAAGVLARLQKLLSDESVDLTVDVKHNEPFTVKPERPTRIPQPSKNGDGFHLTATLRAVLDAIGSFPNGATRQRVAVYSGRSIKSSSFQGAFPELKKAGMIEQRSDKYLLTPDGEQHAEAKPGATLQDWYAKLVPSESNVLKCLAEAYPDRLTREQVSERTGQSMASSSFQSAFPQLRDLELIEGRSDFRLNEILAG